MAPNEAMIRFSPKNATTCVRFHKSNADVSVFCSGDIRLIAIRPAAKNRRDLHRLVAPHDVEFHLLTWFVLSNPDGETIEVGNVVAIDLRNHVALHEARRFGRALHVNNGHAFPKTLGLHT